MQYTDVYNYVVNRIDNELHPMITYHNLEHTLYVLKAAIHIGEAENISEHEMALLKTAAMLHDIGFIRQYNDHERISCDIGKEILPDFGYSKSEIDDICSMILSTKLPQSPSDQLSEILCDADLFYLGSDQYHKFADRLFQEFKFTGVVETEKQWVNLQIRFLSDHEYFTETARKERTEGKEEILKGIKKKKKSKR